MPELLSTSRNQISSRGAGHVLWERFSDATIRRAFNICCFLLFNLALESASGASGQRLRPGAKHVSHYNFNQLRSAWRSGIGHARNLPERVGIILPEPDGYSADIAGYIFRFAAIKFGYRLINLRFNVQKAAFIQQRQRRRLGQQSVSVIALFDVQFLKGLTDI